MKRQSIEQKEMFANHVFDKGLSVKIYKEYTHTKYTKNILMQLSSEKPNNPTCRQPATHEKMLNVTNHQQNANQDHEIPPHTCQNGFYKKDKK